MSNALDYRFKTSPRRGYILKNSELTATCQMNSRDMWQASLKFTNGKSESATFFHEDEMRRYLNKQTKYELIQAPLPTPESTAPAYVDVAAAKRAMVESGQGRRYDPRVATAEPAPRFTYTEEAIRTVNASILRAFLVSNPGAMLDHPHNNSVLQRALQDMLDEVPGMLLNDENIQHVIDWLNENHMLYDGTNKVEPYRTVSQIQQDAAAEVKQLTAEEVERRKKLPLAELQKLIEQETGQSLGAGLTPGLVPGSNPKQAQTATVTPLRDISDDEKNARALSTEELRAIEIARQRANRKDSSVYGNSFPVAKPSGKY